MRAFGKKLLIIIRLAAVMTAAAAAVLLILFAAGNRFYIVRSGSMEPAVHTGDLIAVNSRYDYDRIKAGDIITYRAENGAYVTHRVTAVTDEGFETKGDANSISDGSTVKRENYLGREWLDIPRMGYICSKLFDKRGRIILITAAAAMLIISFFPEDRDNGEERRRRDNEESA